MLRALRLSSSAATAMLLGLMIHVGQPGEPWWWSAALPFAFWACGPAVLPYIVARRWQGRRGLTLTMLAFLIASSLWSAHAYYRAFFVSRSSTAGIALVVVPLCQWLALALAILLGLGAARWTARRRARR